MNAPEQAKPPETIPDYISKYIAGAHTVSAASIVPPSRNFFMRPLSSESSLPRDARTCSV
jgi:hypothetical protein